MRNCLQSGISRFACNVGHEEVLFPGLVNVVGGSCPGRAAPSGVLQLRPCARVGLCTVEVSTSAEHLRRQQSKLATEYPPGQEVNIKVAGVVRQPEFVYHGPDLVVREMSLPSWVGFSGFAPQLRASFLERRKEDVKYGDRKRRRDEIRRDGQEHDRRRRRSRTSGRTSAGSGSVADPALKCQRFLAGRQSPGFTDHQDVEDEDGDGYDTEHNHLRDPRVDGPGRSGSFVHDDRTQSAFSVLWKIRPEVTLDGIDGQGEEDEKKDGHDRPPGRAVSLPLEGETDRDVSFDGEAEHKEWTQLLTGQKEDGKQLTQAWMLEQAHIPFRLQFEEYLGRDKKERTLFDTRGRHTGIQ